MPSSEEIAAQLAELTANLAKAEEALAPMQDEMVAINAEKYAAEQAFKEIMAKIQKERTDKLNELAEKQKPLEEKLFQAQSIVNNTSAHVQHLQWQLEKAKQDEEKAAEEAKKLELEKQKAIEAAARDKVLTEKWDMLTMGLPWREWAKNHQIDGAHQMVMNRYVICADPMGLGKTLTSIITCDMAERATKDASEEFPWMGIEEQVYVPAKWHNKVTGEDINWYVGPGKREALKNDPDWEQVEAHYETKIVDAVTRPVGRKILYICPASLLRNVKDEWERWSPNRNVTFIGGVPKAERNYFIEKIMPMLDNYVIIVNFEAWRRDKALLDKLLDQKFDTVIVDEAHNAKEMDSQIYKGIDHLLSSSSRPEFVIPMTGTPVMNKPQELFTLLTMVNPKEFYNLNDFLYRYCEQYEDSNGVFRWRFKEGGMDLLSKKISKNFMRRTKEQAGIELPPNTVILHELEVDEELYPKQAEARKQMREWATIIINKTEGEALSAPAKIAIITRLRQIETWPAGIIQYETYTDEKGNKQFVRDPKTGEKRILLQVEVYESQKVDYVIRYEDGEWEGLIPEAITDERMVLFSQFKAPLHEIADRVNKAGWRAVVYDGDTPDKLRDEIRRDFDATYTKSREDSKWDIVLCHYKSGGVGLNFTCASQLISLDDAWNPAVRDQAFGRIDRIGQTLPTTTHIIRDKQSIDDWMANIMEDKDAMVKGFATKMESAISGQDLLNAIESGLI